MKFWIALIGVQSACAGFSLALCLVRGDAWAWLVLQVLLLLVVIDLLRKSMKERT